MEVLYASESFMYCIMSSKEPFLMRFPSVETTPVGEVNSVRIALDSLILIAD